MTDMEPVAAVLSRLSGTRPIFHSEADFQHALAMEFARVPSTEVRLEVRPFPNEARSLDMLVRNDSEKLAIELKHLTRAVDVELAGERFVLKDQGAQDISAYDCWKDIVRLESFVSAGIADAGCFVLLTNDPLYWKPPARPGAGYDAFRLNEGRQVRGALEWGARAGPGTRRGREAPLILASTYELAWLPYSQVGQGVVGAFKALVLNVGAPGTDLSEGGVE